MGTEKTEKTRATKKRDRNEVDDTYVDETSITTLKKSTCDILSRNTAAPVASASANATRSTPDSRKRQRVATQEESAGVSCVANPHVLVTEAYSYDTSPAELNKPLLIQ